jgi:hypothetical protein
MRLMAGASAGQKADGSPQQRWRGAKRPRHRLSSLVFAERSGVKIQCSALLAHNFRLSSVKPTSSTVENKRQCND